MELMDTSLDKFYKKVIEKGLSIPEDILGKIAVSVRPPPSLPVRLQPNVATRGRSVTPVCFSFGAADRESSGASAQQFTSHPPR